MGIYLIDYENVYIEGLTGLERLGKSDEVVIFYTQNRCGLTFELHRRLISSKAKLQLMEVAALSTKKNTVKNALDLQLSMYIGYLIGSCPKKPLYIISKDTDFDLNLSFYRQYLQGAGASLSIYATIENALDGVPEVSPVQLLEKAEETAEEAATPEPSQEHEHKKKDKDAAFFSKQLRQKVSSLLEIEDKQAVNRICAVVTAAEDLLALNNLLSRYYHDGKQVKEIYHKLKPEFGTLKELAKV